MDFAEWLEVVENAVNIKISSRELNILNVGFSALGEVQA